MYAAHLGSFRSCCLALLGTLALTSQAVVAQHYYRVPVDKLNVQFDSGYKLVPRAVFNENVEAWVCPKVKPDRSAYTYSYVVAIESAKPLPEVSGTLYLSDQKGSRLRGTQLTIDLTNYSCSRTQFYQSQEYYYELLCNRNIPGRAWFEYKKFLARKAQDLKPEQAPNRRPNNFRRGERRLDLFTGSQAITENLQIDRELLLSNRKESDTVDIDSIKGITVQEFDFAKLLGDSEPTLDSLSPLIPYDQHVVFVHSLDSVVKVLQETNELFAPVSAFAYQTIDTKVVPRYFQQMNLDVAKISRAGLGQKINEIAITGSDPFSELGTDIGVIIELADKTAAEKLANLLCPEDVEPFTNAEPLEGIENSKSIRSETRSLSLFLFQQGNRVWVSNSEYQLRYLKNCADQKVQSLSTLTEYHFFRKRYRLDTVEDKQNPEAAKNTAGETAFAYMSDAAIRRWCGPKWRIGQSRRRWALAQLQSLQAEYLNAAFGLEPGETLPLDESLPDRLGQVKLTHHGVHSEHYGSLAFLTPISELDLKQVTVAENDAYVRWRNGYQRNWRNAFDPIGIQLKISEKRIESDISVIPLILGSDYRFLKDGTAFEPLTGDLHGNSLVHLIFAPGRQDFLLQFFKDLHFVEFFVDDAPELWKDFVDAEDAENYLRQNFHQIPLALGLTFKTEKALDDFYKQASGFADVIFESRVDKSYKGYDYFRRDLEDVYVGRAQSVPLFIFKDKSDLWITFRETTLKQIMDRKLERKADPMKRSGKPWVGNHLAFQTNPGFYRAVEAMATRHLQTELRLKTWENFPILLEWSREFPQENPLEVHKRFWNQEFLCVGGGEIMWDDENQTAMSTRFGSPVRPKIPMSLSSPLKDIQSIDAGVTFETGGVRGRLIMERK